MHKSTLSHFMDFQSYISISTIISILFAYVKNLLVFTESMLKLWDTTSKFCAITMFVTVYLQRTFHAEYVCIFINLDTKLHTPSF
jgi:hypothetical protein